MLMALSDEDAVVRVAAAAHGLTRVSRTCICAAACSHRAWSSSRLNAFFSVRSSKPTLPRCCSSHGSYLLGRAGRSWRAMWLLLFAAVDMSLATTRAPSSSAARLGFKLGLATLEQA